MIKKSILFFLIYSSICFGQSIRIKSDTIYFPFYNDVQMIEIKYNQFNATDEDELNTSNFSKVAQPRDRVLSEYFFRNKKGEILKAFNTTHSLADLNKYFNSKPNPTSDIFITHKTREFQKTKSEQFNHHYRILSFVARDYYKGNLEKIGLPGVGLIDSLGNVKVKPNYELLISIDEEILASKRNLYGIIDYNETEILPFEFDSYLDDFEGFADKDYLLFTKGLNYTKQNRSKIIVGVYFKKSKSFKSLDAYHSIYLEGNQPIIPVYKFGRLGFLDANFNEILPPTYEMSDYNLNSNGIFRVAQNGKYGFVNQNGKIIIPIQYDYVTSFSADSIALILKNGKFSCLNSKGKRIRKCDLTPDWFIAKDNIQNDYQLLMSTFNDYYGLYNKTKKEFLIPFQIDVVFESRDLGDTTSEFYQFRDIETNKLGIVNLNTNQKSASIYDYVREIYNGLLIVRKEGFEGLIDQNFNTIIDFKYPELRFSLVNPEHLYFRDNKYHVGMMNLNEQIIIEPSTTYLHANPNYTKTQKDDLFGILDKNGQELIPIMYDEIEDFGSHNLLIVTKNKKQGVVNYQHEIIVPIEYDIIYPANHKISREGYITVYKNIIKYGMSTSETTEIKIDFRFLLDDV